MSGLTAWIWSSNICLTTSRQYSQTLPCCSVMCYWCCGHLWSCSFVSAFLPQHEWIQNLTLLQKLASHIWRHEVNYFLFYFVDAEPVPEWLFTSVYSMRMICWENANLFGYHGKSKLQLISLMWSTCLFPGVVEWKDLLIKIRLCEPVMDKTLQH